MKGDARDLVISDVADFDSAGVHVSQHHVCFAEAAEIAEIHELPFETDRAQERGIGGVVVADVVDLQTGGIAVAQDHVGRVGTIKAAETDKLPIGSDVAQGRTQKRRRKLSH